MDNKSHGLGLTAITKVRKIIACILVDIIIFLHQKVLRYTVCKVELPNPEIFPYPGKPPYPIKVSRGKSEYFFKNNNS